jgi:O-antigen ligase
MNNFIAGNKRYLYGIMFFLSLASLFASKSATSIIAFVVSASFIILFIAATTKRNSVKIFFLTLAAFNAVACLIYTIKNGNLPFDAIIDLIFRATDKSTTLSGRTHLWQIMSSEVSRHPWLGTGFGGFWVGQDGPSGAVIHRLDWGPPTQAHSGYIDGVNEIGILGMALFLVVIFFHITRCFKLHLNGMTASFIFHFTIVSSFLISNYTETSLLQGTNLYFVIVMCSVIEVYNRARTFDTTQVRLNSSPN